MEADMSDPPLATPGVSQLKGVNAPFACNACGRSYSRLDHLARHYRSHTKERPFPCVTCGKHFSRADLLRRHAAGHKPESGVKKRAQTNTAPNPPVRVSLACTACSAAKVKCEEGKPCSRCYQKGIPCVTPEGTSGTHVHLPPGGQHQGAINNQQNQQPIDSTGMASSQVNEPSEDSLMQLGGERASVIAASIPVHFPTLSPTQQTMPNMQSLISSQNATSGGEPDPWSNSSLGDFLADVMMPLASPSNLDPSNTSGGIPEIDLLDVGVEHGVDFNVFDFALFDTHNNVQLQDFQLMPVDDPSEPPSRADGEPGQPIDSRASEAFRRSLWRFIPDESHAGQCEQLNLSLPVGVGVTSSHTVRPCQVRLSQSTRDKIMAMAMRTCDQNQILRIVSHFPSADVLDCLVQDHLFYLQTRAVSHIHIPTYDSNELRPELIAMTAACGAVRSEVPAVRQLGYALQEAVRLTLPMVFEQDNRTIRDAQILQSYLMSLDVGIWSGNKRKMEISESHLLPLITMLRRAGRFQPSRPRPEPPKNEDLRDDLERKWRAWTEAETLKRLVFAAVLHDTANSASFFAPPLVAYGEVALEMPASEKLWNAPTAQAWSEVYLLLTPTAKSRLPNVASCMRDAHVMLEASDTLDIKFCKHILLCMFWRQIWSCRQLNASTKTSNITGSGTAMLLASSHWQQDLSQAIQHFRMTLSDIDSFSPPANLICEHLLLHIYVSFEDLSRFAGKEGMQEARRALPLLRQWAQSRDSRQAVWHAGQIIREASKFKAGMLRDFPAVALYHAGLTLWAYGLLSVEIDRPHRLTQRTLSTGAIDFANVNSKGDAGIAIIDEEESAATQKFIGVSRATPAIRSRDAGKHSQSTNGEGGDALVFLDSPTMVMQAVISVLQRNHGAARGRSISGLVENLTRLMYDLSYAASKINVK